MKCGVAIFLALIALAAGVHVDKLMTPQDRSLSSQVVDWMEYQKGQMPCGFPGLNVGPLAPAKLSHKDIAIKIGIFAMEGEIKNFLLYGLDNFDIVEFKINAILSKVTFKFHWHNVNFDTVYRMMMRMNRNLKLGVLRDGNAKLAIKDFVLWGTAKYKLGLTGNGVSLKEFKAYAKVGKVKSEIENLSGIQIINKKINEIIEEWITLAINDNTDNFAEITDSIVVPLINNLIGGRSLTELIGLISGGGGGEGGESVPKEPCVPPKVLN